MTSQRLTFLAALAVPVFGAQPAQQLLTATAEYYRTVASFDVKGVMYTDVPGSSWRFTADFESAAAEPRLFPSPIPFTKRQTFSVLFANAHPVRVDAAKNDAFPPNLSFSAPFLVDFASLDKRVLEANRAGSATLMLNGERLSCEIIDVVYDASPDIHPGSKSYAVRYWINPERRWVLKETVRGEQATGHPRQDWTFEVNAMKVNGPAADALVANVESRMAKPATRPEWSGREMPNVTATDLAGHRVPLASLKGKTLLLDFWGSYCPPCAQATAIAEKIAREYADRGVQSWGITQDTAADARAWLALHHLSIPTLLDDSDSVFKAFDIEGVPATVLIGPNGKVLDFWTELQEEKVIRSAVDRAVTQAMSRNH
jgi:peroxiredoxin